MTGITILRCRKCHASGVDNERIRTSVNADMLPTAMAVSKEPRRLTRVSGLRSNVSFGAKALAYGTDIWAGLLATGSHY